MIPPPGMRFAFPPPPPPLPDDLPLDASGQVDWCAAWKRELEHLRVFTEDAEKNGADAEWYRQMLFKVRAVMLMPLPPPDIMVQEGPPGGGEPVASS
jgi:forkhead box protein J2/3